MSYFSSKKMLFIKSFALVFKLLLDVLKNNVKKCMLFQKKCCFFAFGFFNILFRYMKLSYKYYRKNWFERGKVICTCHRSFDGVNYRHPIRPFTGCWSDTKLIDYLLAAGEVVVVVDYGIDYSLPEVYNDIVQCNSQLTLNFD